MRNPKVHRSSKFQLIIPLGILVSFLCNAEVRSDYTCYRYQHLFSVTVSDNFEFIKSRLNLGETVPNARNYKCSDFNYLDQLVGRFKSLIPFEPLMPNLTIQSRPTSVGENSYHGGNIEMGLDFLSKIDQESFLAAFSHEYGHLVFDHYLAQNFDELKYDYDRVSRSTKKLLPFRYMFELLATSECAGLEIENYNHWSETNHCSIKIKQYLQSTKVEFQFIETFLNQKEDEVLDQQIGGPKSKESNYSCEEVIKSYNELFADIFTTIFTQDPDYMYRNLSRRFPERENSLRCRSFTIVLSDSFSTDQPHCNLSLIRSSLWTHWLEPRIKNKMPPKIIIEELGLLLSREAYNACNQIHVKPNYSIDVSNLKKALKIP